MNDILAAALMAAATLSIMLVFFASGAAVGVIYARKPKADMQAAEDEETAEQKKRIAQKIEAIQNYNGMVKK